MLIEPIIRCTSCRGKALLAVCSVMAVLISLISCSRLDEAPPQVGIRSETTQPVSEEQNLASLSQWSAIPSQSRADLYNLVFTNEKHGWVAAERGLLLRSVDGGASWMRSRVNGIGNIHQVTFSEEGRGWVVGATLDWPFRDTLVATVDEGTSWSPAGIPGIAEVSSLFFVDPVNGWAFGKSVARPGRGAVARTTDGGRSWTVNEIPPDPESGYERLGHGIFLSATEGWSITGYSIKHTTDGGITWETRYDQNARAFQERKTAHYTWGLNGILFSNAKVGWAWGGNDGEMGYLGVVLHTSDGGVTWTENLAEHPVDSVVFLNDSTGLAVGGARRSDDQTSTRVDGRRLRDGIIMATTDGGSHWPEVYRVKGCPLSHITLLPNGSVFAVGEGGTILRLSPPGKKTN